MQQLRDSLVFFPPDPLGPLFSVCFLLWGALESHLLHCVNNKVYVCSHCDTYSEPLQLLKPK